MELFGTNFSIALGAWKLRFVLMIEETEDSSRHSHAGVQPPHHIGASQNRRAGV